MTWNWDSHFFAQPEPITNQVCFLSEFRNLNEQLKRKQYPIANTNEMLLKLEGFSVRYIT